MNIPHHDRREHGSSQSLWFLIVDDDPTVTQTFGRILRLNGYEVVTAHDAQSALLVMESSRPDGVIVDLRMPATNGLAFVRQVRLREGDCHIPIAMITGDYFLNDDESRELRELDVRLHFKPLWLENLLQIAEQLVREGSKRGPA